MGVHGLWELLSPVGRRVSVETLAGKTLAIDASIWMVQFIKAMRDEKGEMVRNAHLLGFFRRICKLLFLRTKPVFVFDGGTPALKRRTVIARRRQRDVSQAKVRKTAEKLLLNHLKAMRLKELADDIKNQKLTQKSGTKSQEKSSQMDFVGNDLGKSHAKELDEMPAAMSLAKGDRNLSQTKISTRCNQEELDEMLAASIAAEENEIRSREGGTSTVINSSDEETILPTANDEVDLAVLAALPQSMQLDILAQLKGKKTGLLKQVDNQIRHEVSDCGKGKGIAFNETDLVGCSSRCDVNATSSSDNQKRIDEMLAACIDMEENAKLVKNASSSLGGPTNKENDGNYDEDEDEDEEMILPAMHSEVDPAVLASLPPSMQLDLLVQMRERLMAENRQKYQKVKKDPSKFSELQIQSYLKTVAFRREINEVQKAAVGGGVGGIQTSRIASEANREYIFSSSFSGDKQGFTSTRLERNVEDTQQMERGTHPPQNFVNSIEVGNVSNISAGLVCGEPSEPVDESIETYLDERGRVRVSRSRAMGMRMTRDIQRNLDLMKEIEHDRRHTDKVDNIDTVPYTETSPLKCSGNQLSGKTREVNFDIVGDNVQNEELMLGKNTPIEISFEYDCKDEFASGGDDIFASLVGGISMEHSHADDTVVKTPCGSDSDCDWEEGIVQGNNTISPGYNKVELKSSVTGDYNNNESEEEWEEGDCNGTKSTLFCASEPGKLASKGQLEEESDLQEAIRRSLESTRDGKLKCVSSLDEHSSAYEKKLDPNLGHGDNNEAVGDKNENYMTRNDPETFHQLNSSVTFKSKNSDTLINEPNKLDGHDNSENSISDGNVMMVDEVPNLVVAEELLDNHKDTFKSKNSDTWINEPSKLDGHDNSENSISDGNVTVMDEVPNLGVAEEFLDNHKDGNMSFCCNNLSKVDPLSVTEEEKKKNNNDSEALSNSSDNTKAAILRSEPSLKGAKDLDLELKLPSVDTDGNLSTERTSNLSQGSMITPGDFPVQLDEVRLNEEMEILDREYMNLEKEQRKFERNAESVDSELFTECQELLQMFGLPYIIAPMEAEAQCAYLELSKLVDGVVTDDSDVLLFGARSVYKNIFDDRKYVETYFMEDIEKELGLTREKLIRMALLLGSDYTEGVSGIGIVNAIEVVTAFPEEDGFQKFRQWVESPDPTILGRLDAKSASKKGSKLEEKESPDHIQETKQIFMDKHRNVSKNWHIPSSFPSETVISAYISPEVDKSTEPFAWGKPDQLVLRKMCWEKFGWSSQKADELLLPVLKQYNKHATQLRLEAFYSFNEKFAKIRSKRINKALKGITGKSPSDGTEEEEGLAGRKKSKRKETMERKNDRDIVAKKHTKKNKINDVSTSTPEASKVEMLQPCMQTEEQQHDGKELTRNKSGSRRGRGKGVGVKRSREKKGRYFQSEAETSSSSSDNENHEMGVQIDGSTVTEAVRRSKRSRKPVNYSFQDLEVEDAVDSFDQNNQTCLREEGLQVKSSSIADARVDSFSRGIESNNMIEIPMEDNLPAYSLEPETDAGAPTPNTHPSDDYLEMGGGFCADDSEMDNNHDAIDDMNTATTISPRSSEFLGEFDHDKSSSDILFSGTEKVTSEIQDEENAHHNNESYEVAFSAMPFLRKKRKK